LKRLPIEDIHHISEVFFIRRDDVPARLLGLGCEDDVDIQAVF